jgi:hypothetical protein
MKLKWIVLSGVLGVVAVLLACLLPAPAGDAGSSTPFIALSAVPVPEIPAKAAALVQAAAAPDREQTARAVLQAVAAIARPGVLPYVVSAVCRDNPEMAATVVVTAIQLHPEDILFYAKAAVCAAPGQVEQIVAAACLADSSSFANVALIVSMQMPSANNLILKGLVRAIPGLDPFLEKAEIQAGPTDFDAVIRLTAQLVNDALKAQAK